MSDIVLKDIVETINSFEDFQKIEVLKIINKNNIKYTKNRNGIFVNMRLLKKNQLEEIQKIILFIKNIDK